MQSVPRIGSYTMPREDPWVNNFIADGPLVRLTHGHFGIFWPIANFGMIQLYYIYIYYMNMYRYIQYYNDIHNGILTTKATGSSVSLPASAPWPPPRAMYVRTRGCGAETTGARVGWVSR